MPVRSVQVTSIEARRFTDNEENNPQQVRIDHNSTVTLIQKVADDAAQIDFRYTASYGGLGIIKLEGQVAFQGDATSLHSTWQSTNEMPQEIASEVHTAVMRNCVPEAVGLAQDLQLPPPIPLPQIQFDQEQGASGETSGGGPEIH